MKSYHLACTTLASDRLLARPGRMQWSPDGGFLATRSDAAGGAVWVWDVARMCLAAVLQHACSVCELAWNPKPEGDAAQLAVVTASPSVYFWTPSGATCVQIPLQGFQVRHAECLQPLFGPSETLERAGWVLDTMSALFRRWICAGAPTARALSWRTATVFAVHTSVLLNSAQR